MGHEKERLIEIPLLPTAFTLDAYVIKDGKDCGDFPDKTRRKLSKMFVERYGANFEYYYEEQDKINQVFDLRATKESLLKGHRRIVMVVNETPSIVVHEAFHVLMRLAKMCAVEVNYDSQEWGACMIEYIFEQIVSE